MKRGFATTDENMVEMAYPLFGQGVSQVEVPWCFKPE